MAAFLSPLACGTGLFGQAAGVSGAPQDSLLQAVAQADAAAGNATDDTTIGSALPDSVGSDFSTLRTIPFDADSIHRADSLKKKRFLDSRVSGTFKDSMDYRPPLSTIDMYRDANVKYTNVEMKADYAHINAKTGDIYALGSTDSLGLYKQPEFNEGKGKYALDTVRYNMKTKKLKGYTLSTQQGENYLHGEIVKIMPNKDINVGHGLMTTCNHPHPHFGFRMSKGKAIPGKKMIFGFSYMELEDVPVYPLMLPFGFVPLMSGRNSGFIFPEIGEETSKGFFVRNGGYYFALNDYIDITATGGIYTLGSWEAALSSGYRKRYSYNGQLAFRYSQDILGEKGTADYQNMSNFRFTWTHSQDPKFNPTSTFAASVNFGTSSFNKYSTQSLSEYLTTQTNSSISYSKNWAGTPFSFSTNLQHSQNSRDTTIMLSLPNFSFNVSRFNPLKRKEAVGKQRWYEKISMSYSGVFSNSVTTKEYDLFDESTLDKMRTGMKHNVPVTTSFSLFKGNLNISPSFTYNERWYFKKISKSWDTGTGMVASDTTNGFYRVWDYSLSVGGTTRIYGMFDFGNKGLIQKMRHVMTPTVGFSYTPDFGKNYYESYVNGTGTITWYTPFEGSVYGVPGRGKSAAMTFGLGNNIEMKVRDRRDTVGTRKMVLIDQLQISSSYNFAADSMNLAPFTISGRTSILKNFGINFGATLDPYMIDDKGRRIDQYTLSNGKGLGRMTAMNFSFGYTFSAGKTNTGGGPGGGQAHIPTPQEQSFIDHSGIDPAIARQMMSAQYYDFSVPWSLSFNYSFNYTKPGHDKKVVQSLGFNGSVSPTEKWRISLNGGYDFVTRKFTPGAITLGRDLHCFTMDFSWVPLGFRQSWSFTIRVKASSLKDLKYDKKSSFLDNLYD